MNPTQSVLLQVTRTHLLYGWPGLYIFMALLTEISRKLSLFSQDSTAPTHILGTPRLLLRHNEPIPVCSTTGHNDTPYMDGQDSRSLWLYYRKLPLFSPDSTAPIHILGTPRLLLRHNEPNRVRLTTGHKDTPPIWMARTLQFIKVISRKLPLFLPDSTAPTHILGTPQLLLRHNEHNPVRLTTGYKDTPHIWMARTLRLYGFIN